MGEARPLVDVYLFPAPVGGGRGDIDEVFTAGTVLAASGARVRILRLPGRTLPSGLEPLSRWPRFPRVEETGEACEWALTVSASWGVNSAPERRGPLGRAGPWADESGYVERRYGRRRTIHVSFEEFARTLTAREQSRERYREAGWTSERVRRFGRTRRFRNEVNRFRAAYRRFRALDRTNVLSVFPGFERDSGFQREFPEAVQTGPLWPESARRRLRTPGRWVWYANSPGADRLAPRILRGLARSPRPVRLELRADGAWVASLPRSEGWRTVPPSDPEGWVRRFNGADVRIVTGSRSLLEALRLGGPFLYFNGVVGAGRTARRHRPEKLAQLLHAYSTGGATPEVVRDLADFGRGRRVEEVVARAVRPEWQRSFPRTVLVHGYRSPFDSANAFLGELLRRVRDPRPPSRTAQGIVAELRELGQRTDAPVPPPGMRRGEAEGTNRRRPAY